MKKNSRLKLFFVKKKKRKEKYSFCYGLPNRAFVEQLAMGFVNDSEIHTTKYISHTSKSC